MKINKGKLALFSLSLNLLLFGVGGFFALKRWHFQQKLEHPTTFPAYQDNPQFVEQVNIQSAYRRPEKIILLGNSHIYKAHWDELLNRGDVGNRGIGSDITEGYLHRLQYIFSAHPAICFLEGGTNDVWYGIPDDAIIRNLSVLVDTLRTARIIPVLHTIPPISTKEIRSTSFNSRVQTLNKRIMALAAQKGVDYIDLYTLLSEDGGLPGKYGQTDGVHLTSAGYLIWAAEMGKILASHHI